jgi:hypothetical protein
MAPRRLEGLLALTLKTAADRRTRADCIRGEGADPADGLRKPPLGSATDPSRAGEAGIQGLCPHRSEVHAPALCQVRNELFCIQDSMMALASLAVQAGPNEYWKVACVGPQRAGPVLVGERYDEQDQVSAPLP